MMDQADTSPTLLTRLRQAPTDQAAWGAFVERYGAMISGWCRRWGVQSADTDDIRQNILLDLAKQMHRFEYDASGSFRAWLKTVCYRAWCDFCDRRRGDLGTGGSTVLDLLQSVEARENFLQEFEEEWDRELLEIAMKNVRGRVQEHTWEVFRLMTQDELSGADVAERLGMKVGAVWVAKSKVQKMLRDEIEAMELASAVRQPPVPK